jgi:hypothetical protein
VPAPSLDDAKTRWNRAGEHVNSLNAACQTIIKSGGYGFEPDCDADGKGKIVFHDRVDPELLRLTSTFFGEVISNLWAARNYVVWHLACLRENTELPSNWQYMGFPVFKAEPGPTETFWGRAQGKLKGLTPADVAEIETVQPYQTGNPDPATGLRQADPTAPHYVLEELAILDRHRRLAVTALFPVFMHPDVLVVSGDATISNLTPDESKIGKALKDGDVIASFLVKNTTECVFATSPGAIVQIFPRDVVTPGDGTNTFDVWVRWMQQCVADLIDKFAPEFGEDLLNWSTNVPRWPGTA